MLQLGNVDHNTVVPAVTRPRTSPQMKFLVVINDLLGAHIFGRILYHSLVNFSKTSWTRDHQDAGGRSCNVDPPHAYRLREVFRGGETSKDIWMLV